MTVLAQAVFLFLFALVGTLVDDFLTKRDKRRLNREAVAQKEKP
jgi:hypothetical protein